MRKIAVNFYPIIKKKETIWKTELEVKSVLVGLKRKVLPHVTLFSLDVTQMYYKMVVGGKKRV